LYWHLDLTLHITLMILLTNAYHWLLGILSGFFNFLKKNKNQDYLFGSMLKHCVWY